MKTNFEIRIDLIVANMILFCHENEPLKFYLQAFIFRVFRLSLSGIITQKKKTMILKRRFLPLFHIIN